MEQLGALSVAFRLTVVVPCSRPSRSISPDSRLHSCGTPEPTNRKRIRIDFVGENEGIAELADRYGVRENVNLVAPLPYLEALRRQMDSDLVLLLQWNDPAEQGNVPGKLFEYLATRRPILGHGYEDGVPASIIAEQKAGLYSNDPDAVARYLVARLDEKHHQGEVAANPVTVCAGFDRDTAYDKLATFLANLTSTR